MKVAVVGSRGIEIKNLGEYIPKNVTEIVSGGAKGVDCCARNYAIKNKIKLTEFFPQYNLYGKSAPLKRNIEIINYSDYVLAYWDGQSRGTKFVIENCRKKNIPIKVIIVGF